MWDTHCCADTNNTEKVTMETPKRCTGVTSNVVLVLILVTSYILPTHASDVCAEFNCTCPMGEAHTAHDYQVKCIDKGLDEIPTGLPNMLSLHLHGNRIETLSNLEGYTNLVRVSLENNGIKRIPPGTFERQPNLEKLDLSYNLLKSVSNSSFWGLTNVRELYLKGNPLTTFPDGLFSISPFPMLQFLDVSACQLRVIHEKAFYGVSALKHVNMSSNLLPYPVQFHGASQLQVLDLSHNYITELGHMPFDGLRNLKDLYLSYNKISEIRAHSFRDGLTSLRTIHLRANVIHTVRERTFANLTSLRDLDLSANQIGVISKDILPVTLSRMRLQDNPLQCGCDVGWMLQMAAIFDDEPKCATPASASGTPIRTANIHLFDCPDPHHGFHSNTVALAIGLLVAIILAVLASLVLYKGIVHAKKKKVPTATLR